MAALFIAGLSEGEEPALQGLATSLIDRSYHARLFTSVTVLEILAKLVGGPVMGRLFAISRANGNGSLGLCFSVSAVRLASLALILAPFWPSCSFSAKCDQFSNCHRFD